MSDRDGATPSTLPANEDRQPKHRAIKCVVWDLDETLWRGTLLEDSSVNIHHEVVNIVKTLDKRGILQSVASKNDEDHATEQLRTLGLYDYFLYPQIGWNAKSDSIIKIAEYINIGLDSIAFIDDQPFERDEVKYSLPQVLCLDAADIDSLLSMPELNPRFVTSDSRQRRQMMMSDITRQEVEREYAGPKEAFLASLHMELTIFPAKEQDLQRAEELTERTNQLNATGYTYSYEELQSFHTSPNHKLIMARLEDKYGTYGHIGLALVECGNETWTIKLLLMSCRVMSRGVGGAMLSYIMQLASQSGVELRAEFVGTKRNRMMNITYRFSGFYELTSSDDFVLFAHNLVITPPYPEYLVVHIHD